MKTDVVVVGAGIVGLAAALKILEKRPGVNVLVLEKESREACHQTGHNSGVIHSGVYYRPGSGKAINCVRGYQWLLDFCEEEEIAYEICGKLIVAGRDEELTTLKSIQKRGEANGLKDLRWLHPEQAQEIEPHVRCIAALHVPQAGIVDFKQVAAAMLRRIKKTGGQVVFSEAVKDIICDGQKLQIVTDKNDYQCQHLVNCAGLHSDRLARRTRPRLDVRIVPFRGEYYVLDSSAEALVKNLIYPVPDPRFPFLGVHCTRMVGGGIEVGPNAVLALAREGYSWDKISLRDLAEVMSWPGFYKVAGRYWRTGLMEVHRSLSKAAFCRSLQSLVPEIREEHLLPGGSGVRAQACSVDGRLLDDFYFEESENVTHVLNAPSPAATSSLSIGDSVAERVLKRLD